MEKVFIEAFKQALKFFSKPSLKTVAKGAEKVMEVAAKSKVGKLP